MLIGKLSLKTLTKGHKWIIAGGSVPLSSFSVFKENKNKSNIGHFEFSVNICNDCCWKIDARGGLVCKISSLSMKRKKKKKVFLLLAIFNKSRAGFNAVD